LLLSLAFFLVCIICLKSNRENNTVTNRTYQLQSDTNTCSPIKLCLAVTSFGMRQIKS
jgi:hypothetical protein